MGEAVAAFAENAAALHRSTGDWRRDAAHSASGCAARRPRGVPRPPEAAGVHDAVCRENAAAFGAPTRIFAEEVLALERRRAFRLGIAGAESGLLVFQHRFGGSLNLNRHLHAIAVDCVFTRPLVPPPGASRVSPAPRSRACRARGRRLSRLPPLRRLAPSTRTAPSAGRRRCRVPGVPPSAFEACLRGSLGVGDLHALPDENGEPVPAPDDDARRFALTKSPCAADFGGFGVHAGGTVAEGDAAARARLVRYCARAPLSLERLFVTEDGMVVYRIRRPLLSLVASSYCAVRNCRGTHSRIACRYARGRCA